MKTKTLPESRITVPVSVINRYIKFTRNEMTVNTDEQRKCDTLEDDDTEGKFNHN